MSVICNRCGSSHTEVINSYIYNVDYSSVDYKCAECNYTFRVSNKMLSNFVCSICNKEYYSTVPNFDTLIYTCPICTNEHVI